LFPEAVRNYALSVVLATCNMSVKRQLAEPGILSKGLDCDDCCVPTGLCDDT